ncbi:MAG: DUF930 domain-containing protein, partial [Pseudomonadota bacterium]
SVRMKDETRKRRWNLPWALPASVMLHVLIAALLVFGLPQQAGQPQQEQAVNVALVPPPEQPKPKPAPAPPPKENKAKKPPEPKVENPPEKAAEKPPPPEQPRKPSPIEILKPVFQFGDKDAGPKKSLDGYSAQDSTPAQAKDDNPKAPSADGGERADPTKAGENPAAATKDAESTHEEKQATSAQGTDKQEADKQAGAQEAGKQTAPAPPPLTSAGGDGEVELPTSAKAPQPRPANAPQPSPAKNPAGSEGTRSAAAKSQGYSGLPGVRKLYSQGATGDALATTSMADVPRDQRGAKLCASALLQELVNASYFPDLLPLVLLKEGNVIDVPRAAFHATKWYSVSFRCELDPGATRVLAFTFSVGAAIPGPL